MGLKRRAAAIGLAVLGIAYVTAPAAHAGSAAVPGGKPAKTAEAPPPEIQALLTLMADPKVQAWLAQRHVNEAAAAAPGKASHDSPQEVMSARVEAVRGHLAE